MPAVIYCPILLWEKIFTIIIIVACYADDELFIMDNVDYLQIKLHTCSIIAKGFNKISSEKIKCQ